MILALNLAGAAIIVGVITGVIVHALRSEFSAEHHHGLVHISRYRHTRPEAVAARRKAAAQRSTGILSPSNG